MRVLCLSLGGDPEPWYSETVAALDAACPIALFDSTRSWDSQFADVAIVIDFGGHASPAIIHSGAAAGVRLWQIMGTGLDHSDVAYMLDQGLQVANVPGGFSAVALAEHALLLMLSFAKNIKEGIRNARIGRLYEPMNDELAGQTLGLVGLGASGRALARLASALSMSIIAVDVRPLDNDARAALHLDWFSDPSALSVLLARSDYVSLHVPLDSSTRLLINAEAIAHMKEHCVLINVARGGLVDETALTHALRTHRLRGAGLDVVSTEPASPNHPLFELDNVIITPHVAGGTFGTARRRAQVCAENVRRFVRSEEVLYRISEPPR